MPNWLSGDLIGVLIAVVLMVGSGVVNWLKQQRERSEAQRRVREQQEQVQLRTQLPRGPEAAPPTLVDVAAQRREQLRQLAQQRQLQQGGVTPVGASEAPRPTLDPTNLSMAERVARARAKQQYEQRAEALRRQQAEGAQGAQNARDAARVAGRQADDPRAGQRAAAERARQEARARAKLEAERARDERARQLREQAHRAEQEAKRRAARQRTPTPAPATRQAPPARKAAPATLAAGSAAHRATPLARAPRDGVGFSIDRAAMRQAIILKEVLDRPLALRGPAQGDAF